MAAWSMFLPVDLRVVRPADASRSSTRAIFPKQLMNFGGGDPFSLAGVDRPRLHPPDRDHPRLDLRHRVHDDGGRRRAPARHARGRPRPAAVAPDALRDAPGRAARCSSAWSSRRRSSGRSSGPRSAGVLDELPFERLPLLWLNGMLLWGAIGDDRARGVGLVRPAVAGARRDARDRVVSYFLEILGSLWSDAKGLQPFSLFHYLTREGHPRRHDERRRAGAPGGRRRWSRSPGRRSSSRAGTSRPRADAGLRGAARRPRRRDRTTRRGRPRPLTPEASVIPASASRPFRQPRRSSPTRIAQVARRAVVERGRPRRRGSARGPPRAAAAGR